MSFLDIGIIFPLIGLAGGISVSLVGIGSTLVTLPSLLLILPFYFPSQIAVKIAIATTLSCATVAAISSAIGYMKKQQVLYPLFFRMSFCYLLTAFCGAYLVHYMPGHLIELLLGIILILVSVNLLLHKKSLAQKIKHTPTTLQFLAHITLAGLANSICGIATGTIAIPFLKKYYPLEKAIGTSIASTITACLFGTVAYIIYGFHHMKSVTGLSLGYVYLPAFFPITIGTIIGSYFGFYLKNFLSTNFIKYLLTLLIFSVGMFSAFKGGTHYTHSIL